MSRRPPAAATAGSRLLAETISRRTVIRSCWNSSGATRTRTRSDVVELPETIFKVRSANPFHTARSRTMSVASTARSTPSRTSAAVSLPLAGSATQVAPRRTYARRRGPAVSVTWAESGSSATGCTRSRARSARSVAPLITESAASLQVGSALSGIRSPFGSFFGQRAWSSSRLGSTIAPRAWVHWSSAASSAAVTAPSRSTSARRSAAGAAKAGTASAEPASAADKAQTTAKRVRTGIVPPWVRMSCRSTYGDRTPTASEGRLDPGLRRRTG